MLYFVKLATKVGDNIMFDWETLDRTEKLAQKYKENWGKDVDLTALPTIMTQEDLAKVLERIVETGESVLVGFDKIRNKN